MGRTKGSKNGISTTKGYTAIGKKAVGILDSTGNYVYKKLQDAKAKMKTKDLNPAMPGATAKFLDKKNEAKQKSLEAQRKMAAKAQAEAQAKQMQRQNTQPAQSQPQQKPTDKKQSLMSGLSDVTNKLQSAISNKNTNQNGNTENNKKSEAITTEKPSSKKSGLIGILSELATNKDAREKIVGQVKKFAASAGQAVEKGAVRNLGPNEIKKMANEGFKSSLDKIPDKTERTAKDDDSFGEFVKNDIHDRKSEIRDKAVAKGKEYATNTMNRMLNDERIQNDLKDLAEKGYYGGSKEAMKAMANKITDSGEVRKYASVAADAAVPTYDKRKASNKNTLGSFIKADIQDRINDSKKKLKEKTVGKITSATAKVTKDPRMKKEVEAFKKDPQAAIKQMVQEAKSNPEAAKKYKSVAADVVMPTYEDRKATTDDSFFDFIMNDIQDRSNDNKKKLKKKWING